MKEFHSGFDKELQKVVNGLPLKEKTEMEKNKLLERLSNGDRPHVTLLREGKEQTFYIEATPQIKSVSIYDDQAKKGQCCFGYGDENTRRCPGCQKKQFATGFGK